MSLKSKAERLFHIFDNDGRVEYLGLTFLMNEGKLCTLMQDDSGNEFGLVADCTFNFFLKMAEVLDENYLYLKGCEIALRDMKLEDRARKSLAKSLAK